MSFNLQDYKKTLPTVDKSSYNFVVYCITNLINGKRYVGLTKSFKKRMKAHKCGSGTKAKESLIRRAIKKYGKDSFTYEVLVRHSSLMPVQLIERHYIEYYGSFAPNGYNLTLGGEGTSGKRTAEARLRIAEANKKRCLGKPGKKGPQPMNYKATRAVDLETNEVLDFPSVQAMASIFGHKTTVTTYLRNNKPYKGFKLEYVNG